MESEVSVENQPKLNGDHKIECGLNPQVAKWNGVDNIKQNNFTDNITASLILNKEDNRSTVFTDANITENPAKNIKEESSSNQDLIIQANENVELKETEENLNKLKTNENEKTDEINWSYVPEAKDNKAVTINQEDSEIVVNSNPQQVLSADGIVEDNNKNDWEDDGHHMLPNKNLVKNANLSNNDDNIKGNSQDPLIENQNAINQMSENVITNNLQQEETDQKQNEEDEEDEEDSVESNKNEDFK